MDETSKQPEFRAGEQDLPSLLATLLQKSAQNPEFAATPHYILFTFKTLQSLLKVDMSEKPYQIWHYNLDERPVLKLLEAILLKFLAQNCGENAPEKCFHDLYTKFRDSKVNDTVSGNMIPLGDRLQHGFELLAEETRPVAEQVFQAKEAIPLEKEKAAKGWLQFFNNPKKTKPEAPKLDTKDHNKP